jgi:hypothetical protein
MAKNQKIIKICTEKFIFLNYSKRTSDIYARFKKSFRKCSIANLII